MHNKVMHENKAVHKDWCLPLLPPPRPRTPQQLLYPWTLPESLIGSVGLLFVTTTCRETRWELRLKQWTLIQTGKQELQLPIGLAVKRTSKFLFWVFSCASRSGQSRFCFHHPNNAWWKCSCESQVRGFPFQFQYPTMLPWHLFSRVYLLF